MDRIKIIISEYKRTIACSWLCLWNYSRVLSSPWHRSGLTTESCQLFWEIHLVNLDSEAYNRFAWALSKPHGCLINTALYCIIINSLQWVAKNINETHRWIKSFNFCLHEGRHLMLSVALFQASAHPELNLTLAKAILGKRKEVGAPLLMRNSFPVLKTAEAAASIFQLALFTSSAVNFCFWHNKTLETGTDHFPLIDFVRLGPAKKDSDGRFSRSIYR